MSTSVGTVSVDFKAGVGQLISGVDQINTKLSGLGRAFEGIASAGEKLERGLSFLTKFSLGAGAGIGIAALATHLEHVAEKLSDANPEAKEFVDSMEKLRSSLDAPFIALFGKMAPILEAIASGANRARLGLGQLFGGTGVEGNDLTALTARLEELKAAQAKANSGPQSGLQASSRANFAPEIAKVQKQIDDLQASWGVQIAQAKAALEALTKGDALNAADEAAEKAKKRMVELNDYNEKLIKTRIDNQERNEEEAQKRMVAGDEMIWKDWLARKEDLQKTQTDTDTELWKQWMEQQTDAFKQGADQAKEFGNLFADNLIQASDSGFKSILQSWTRTLEQMALKSAAAEVFQSLFPKGASWGGLISSIVGAFGGSTAATGGSGSAGGWGPHAAYGADFVVGGSGGPDSQSMAISPGERVRVTPPSFARMGDGGGGAQVVNQYNTFQTGVDRSALANAGATLKAQILAEVRQDKKRRNN